MKSRSRSILARLISLLALPLLSLVVLWAIAASITLTDGIALLRVSDRANEIALPGQDLVRALQSERQEAVASVASDQQNMATLTVARRRTDTTLKTFRTKALNSSVSGPVRPQIQAVLNSLDDLIGQRARIDSGASSRLTVADYYTGVIDRLFTLFYAIPTISQSEPARRAQGLIDLNGASELQSEEAAILSGALAAGHFQGDEYSRVVGLIYSERYVYARAITKFSTADQAEFQKIWTGSAAGTIRAMENIVIALGKPTGRPPIIQATWYTATESLSGQISAFTVEATDRLAGDVTPIAIWIIVRLAIAGLLGLLAVAVSILLSIRIGRSLVHELVDVRQSASDLATKELPAVVRRLRAGEDVDVGAEVQPLTGFTIREIAGVATAMDAARSTAIEVAIEEAQLRRGVREVFLNLARRSQTLVHRQLTLLDTMERREKDPDELDDLFQLDHLATRMRRHAEDLIVLSGSTPGRGWRNPVPLVDVMRGAVAEVEDYARVRVVGATRAALAGRGVSDVIHLLAELIENATAFSPPHTTVHVSGELVPAGFAIEIEDRGLGMPPEQLIAVNSRLAEPPEFDLLHSERLGLFVVGQLARRHDIRVVLRGSPFGGTTAIVLLPTAMVIAPDATATHRPSPAGTATVPAGDFTAPVSEPANLTPRALAIAPDLPSPESPPTAEAASPAPITPSRPFHSSPWSDASTAEPAAKVDVEPAQTGPDASDGWPESAPPEPEPDATPPATGEVATVETTEPAQDAAGFAPLARREPGAGWDHLATRTAASNGTGDAPDTRPRGVARAPLASRGVPDAAEDAGPIGVGAPETSPDAGPAAPGSNRDHTSVPGGGLPRRVRQASLAAPLRSTPPTSVTSPEPASMRPPEEVRGLMASYQRGSLLGRTDAARTIANAESALSPMDDRATGADTDDDGESSNNSELRHDEVTAGLGSADGTREGER
jgi:signal transduction histidine kinase